MKNHNIAPSSQIAFTNSGYKKYIAQFINNAGNISKVNYYGFIHKNNAFDKQVVAAVEPQVITYHTLIDSDTKKIIRDSDTKELLKIMQTGNELSLQQAIKESQLHLDMIAVIVRASHNLEQIDKELKKYFDTHIIESKEDESKIRSVLSKMLQMATNNSQFWGQKITESLAHYVFLHTQILNLYGIEPKESYQTEIEQICDNKQYKKYKRDLSKTIIIRNLSPKDAHMHDINQFMNSEARIKIKDNGKFITFNNKTYHITIKNIKKIKLQQQLQQQLQSNIQKILKIKSEIPLDLDVPKALNVTLEIPLNLMAFSDRESQIAEKLGLNSKGLKLRKIEVQDLISIQQTYRRREPKKNIAVQLSPEPNCIEIKNHNDQKSTSLTMQEYELLYKLDQGENAQYDQKNINLASVATLFNKVYCENIAAEKFNMVNPLIDYVLNKRHEENADANCNKQIWRITQNNALLVSMQSYYFYQKHKNEFDAIFQKIYNTFGTFSLVYKDGYLRSCRNIYLYDILSKEETRIIEAIEADKSRADLDQLFKNWYLISLSIGSDDPLTRLDIFLDKRLSNRYDNIRLEEMHRIDLENMTENMRNALPKKYQNIQIIPEEDEKGEDGLI